MLDQITMDTAKNIGETITLSTGDKAEIIARNWGGDYLMSYVVRFKGIDMPVNPHNHTPQLAY